jgi:acylphosphatase
MGRVQGVWYRAWTAEQATARELCGWVRNRRDGSVEAVFSGPETQVEEMITTCYRGPPSAQVEGITRHAFSEKCGLGFETLPTG